MTLTPVPDPGPDQMTVTLPPPALAVYRDGVDAVGDPTGYTWPDAYCGTSQWADAPLDSRGCGRQIDEGDVVRKLDGWWMHDQCARDAITSADVDQAWLLLADQVAQRPHKFRATEIRSVLRAVSTIAERHILRADLASSSRTNGDRP